MVGCGDFARRFHGPAQQRCATQDPGLELQACCDVNGNRAREYSSEFGLARHYSDLPGMLSDVCPDAVVIAVPPGVTCAVASLVFARGFPVLLEKPPGLSREELARLIAAAEMGRAQAQVGFNRRDMPVMRRAREILDDAFAVQPPIRIYYEMMRFDRWDRDFSTTAVHAIDAVRFLAGSPLQMARIAYQPLKQGGRETVAISVELECGSGSRERLEIQPVTGFNAEFVRMHAVGQSLSIRVPYPGRSLGEGSVEHWRGDALVATFSDTGGDAPENLGIVEETRVFLEAVRSGTGFRPSLQECCQQMELMEAIRLRLSGPIFPLAP